MTGKPLYCSQNLSVKCAFDKTCGKGIVDQLFWGSTAIP